MATTEPAKVEVKLEEKKPEEAKVVNKYNSATRSTKGSSRA
ncbi:MAG: hypothetical protein P4M11_11750 [Candidatus Pacebacteria bacterium]|nr:hypothetical protein [Candidatus Paceibacterota bacterium]